MIEMHEKIRRVHECNARNKIVAHILEVREVISRAIQELTSRAILHDASKFGPDEFPLYERHICRMASMEYGTPAYYSCLQDLAPALKHHYEANSHHPEHFPDGMSGMTLIDILELIADWMVASKQNNHGGSFKASLAHNTERFSIGPQLAQIMRNTEKQLSAAAAFAPVAGDGGTADENTEGATPGKDASDDQLA
jgi:hypothetical protein